MLLDLAQVLGNALGLLHGIFVEGYAELARHVGQALELLRIGLAVHAIDRGAASLAEPLGDQLVGEQHQLLDHLIRALDARVLGPPGHRHRRAALLIEVHARLRQIELERTAAHAITPELAGQLVDGLELVLHGLGLSALRSGFAEAERARDAAVGQHRRRAHHAFHELEALDPTFSIQLGDHA